MTERNIHEELLNEVKAARPEVEGYEYLSEDPIGNMVYANDGKDGSPLGVSYKILLGGNPENIQDIKFQVGNPEKEINGITLEALIDIGFDRTQKLNDKIPHWHNNLIIDGLSLAANALNKRNTDRANAGVLNQDKALPRVGTDEFHPIVRRLLTNQEKFNFILMMMIALGESYQDIIDDEAQSDFMEMTPEGPKRLVQTSPAEDEAITLGVANAQKILAVFEETPLFQIILGTMVHGKKLLGESTQSNTTPTAEASALSNDSTQEQT